MLAEIYSSWGFFVLGAIVIGFGIPIFWLAWKGMKEENENGTD